MGSASSSSLMYASYFFGVTHRLRTCRTQRESGTSERQSTNNRTQWTRWLVQQFQFPFRVIPPWLVRSCWIPIPQTIKKFRTPSQDIKKPNKTGTNSQGLIIYYWQQPNLNQILRNYCSNNRPKLSEDKKWINLKNILLPKFPMFRPYSVTSDNLIRQIW